jgi:hypothetical protein
VRYEPVGPDHVGYGLCLASASTFVLIGRFTPPFAKRYAPSIA